MSRRPVEEQASRMAKRLGGFGAWRAANHYSEVSETEEGASYWDHVADELYKKHQHTIRTEQATWRAK